MSTPYPLRSLALLVLMLLIPLAGCRGCGGVESPATSSAAAAAVSLQDAATTARGGGPAAVVSIPQGPWTELANRLVSAKTLNDAIAATREILARGGVATFDGHRDVVEAIGPSAGFSATPHEVITLAVEARRRPTAGRLTAAEFAQMLQTLGWPFAEAAPRAGQDVASRPPVGKMAEDMEEAIRAERINAGTTRRDASRQSLADEDAQREAANQRDAELVKKIQEATLAWQKARQAVAKAPPEGKAAAEAQVQAAWAARDAAIQARNRAREEARTAKQDQREQTRAAAEEERRLQAMRRSIGPDYRAGEHLMRMLAEWVRGAAENPEDPRNFTPLFLAEMARLQDPPVDIAAPAHRRIARNPGLSIDLRGGPRAHLLRFTLLEIQLMAAAFYRGTPEAPRAWAIPSFGIETVVSAQEPCSEFKKTLGKLNAVLAEGTMAVAADQVGAALERAVEGVTGQGDNFGKAMSAMGMAAKIGKLLSFYNNNQVTVAVSAASTHKPPEGPPLVTYTATAGISEEDWKEIENAMKGEDAKSDREWRDCFNHLGLPTRPDLADLAKEAEDWLVEWRITEGSPPHAYFSLKNNNFYLPGRRAMKLVRSGPYSASAKFVVDILPESQQTGKIVSAYVTAEASVDAAGMPSLGTIIGALKGGFGLADALLELCAGWYQFMNMPRAYGTIEVQYHCPKPTVFVPTGKPVADGGGDDGPQDCMIEQGR